MRSRWTFALLLPAVAAHAGCGLRACVEDPVPDEPPAAPAWPSDPAAAWPAGCLIEGVAVHPTHPWLAVACTDPDNERGAVLVFDAAAGTIRTATPFDGNVGWSDSPHLLRWHPDGTRLTTNVDTNGIALLDRGQVVGHAYPDETRDHGVRHVWVGDQLFADTGALFEIRPGDRRFDFDPLAAPAFRDIRWSAMIGAVVGLVPGRGLAAFDPLREQLIYDLPFDADLHAGRAALSADGRWCARPELTPARYAEPRNIRILSAIDGADVATVPVSQIGFGHLYWGPGGALAITSRGDMPEHAWGAWHQLDLFRPGQPVVSLDLLPRTLQGSASVPEASAVAWSPTGETLAVLLDQQQVRLLEASSGATRTTFTARAPEIPEGLRDWYRNGYQPPWGRPGDVMYVGSERVVRLAPHFVAFYTPDGDEVATFVVPADLTTGSAR